MNKILILCTHNSIRSQLAEAIFRHFGNGRIDVKSAGSNPCDVNPNVYIVLKEAGISSDGLYSKNIVQFLNEKFDYVITVCDKMRQICPVLPGEYKKNHWPLEDPGEVKGVDEEVLLAFRNTRNILKALAIDFLNVPLENAELKCPFCGFIQKVEITNGRYPAFYNCSDCGKIISVPEGSCCIICSYSDKVCKEFYKQAVKEHKNE